MTTLKFTRFSDHVTVQSATGGVTIESFMNACEDNDFSLDSNTTVVSVPVIIIHLIETL